MAGCETLLLRKVAANIDSVGVPIDLDVSDIEQQRLGNIEKADLMAQCLSFGAGRLITMPGNPLNYCPNCLYSEVNFRCPIKSAVEARMQFAAIQVGLGRNIIGDRELQELFGIPVGALRGALKASGLADSIEGNSGVGVRFLGAIPLSSTEKVGAVVDKVSSHPRATHFGFSATQSQRPNLFLGLYKVG